MPASRNASRPRNLGEMWAALSQFCTALGQVSTLILQEKSSNTNNDTNTNSNTAQYLCEVFRFLTVVECFGSFKCFGSPASPV